MPKVTIFPQTCKGLEDCGICVFICPKKLFVASVDMNDAGYIPPMPPDESLCTGCGNCMLYCPDFAIVVTGDPAAGEEGGDNE